MPVLLGWLYCYLWYSSILAGYVTLFCPLLPVLFISNKLYRYFTDVIFSYWQYYPTALLEIMCGCEIQVSGDAIETGETSILVMNHRTRTDWNFFWPTLYHSVKGKNKIFHSTKFVLKDAVKNIPGAGWVMQLACFVYVRRCWSRDERTLRDYADYVSDMGYGHSLLVFPEGTDLTDGTKSSSDRFAEQRRLPKYEYVLHPRTTGFAYLTHRLLLKNSLDAVYDLTLVYPDAVPQTERVLLAGNFPKRVKVHFVRYPKSILPKTETGLKDFLEKRWLEKEKIIKEYNATGNFLHGKILRTDNRSELYGALVVWTLLPYFALYMLLVSDVFAGLVFAHTLFLVGLNLFSIGFQTFEIAVYNFKKKLPFHVFK